MMAVSCKRTARFLVGALLFVATAQHSRAQKKVTYSLAELADSANRHFPRLLEKQALTQSAQAGIAEAKHSFLPQAILVEELSVGSANDLTGPFLPVPGTLHSISGSITGASNYQTVTGNLASLYAQYDLVNFGLRGAKVANARAYANLTQADLEKERYLVKWDIGRLYFNILHHRYQLAVIEENIRRYEAMYLITRALTGSGVNPGVDSSLARAGLSRTRIDYNEMTGQLHRMEQQLSYLTGIPSPEIPLDTAAIRNLIAPTLPSDGTTQATASNPLVDYFVKQKFQYDAEVTLARKSYLPKIVLGAGGWARGSSIQYNNVYKSAGEGLGYQRLNYLAGVGLTYDLFNGIHRRDRLNVLSQQANAAGYAQQQQELALNNQAIQADESIRVARANLTELPAQLHAATEAYKQKMAQYKAGIINFVDLANASFELFQAQSGYIQTLNEWYTASLDKAAATGNLDPFIQTVK
ncbi:MAG: TolC family protein [Bacteroidetes bacterium]|nr:TolC family protein [Bacteroidota bacterium]